MKLTQLAILIFLALCFGQPLFAQTVEVTIDGEGCSGFIGKLSTRSERAYVFTAGHCLPGILDTHFPKKNIIHNPIAPAKRFLVRHLKDASQASSVDVSMIVFASFDKYDVAVLDVVESVQHLEAKGINPILVDFSRANLNASVEIFNPLKQETAFCSIEHHVPQLNYQFWRWPQTSRLSKECKLTHGWSGAVVLNRKTEAAVGVLSGGNETGKCDDYCEVANSGENLAIKDRSYFTRLTFLAPCTDRNGVFDPLSCVIL